MAVHVMENRIAVGDFDLAACRHDQGVRSVLAVFLIDQQRLLRLGDLFALHAVKVDKSVLHAVLFTECETRCWNFISADILVLRDGFKCWSGRLSLKMDNSADSTSRTLWGGFVGRRGYITGLLRVASK